MCKVENFSGEFLVEYFEFDIKLCVLCELCSFILMPLSKTLI